MAELLAPFGSACCALTVARVPHVQSDDLLYVTVSTDSGKTFSPPHIIASVDQDTGAGAVYALWLSGKDVKTVDAWSHGTANSIAGSPSFGPC